jgi:PIN domain nuclease of toxin-antitoxin system
LRISVISIWELAMLVKRGRVALPMNVRASVEQALSKPGIAVAPLTPATVAALTPVTKDAQLIRYSRQRHARALEA